MIRILTTGGTIDKVYFDAKSLFEVGEPQIDSLLQQGLATEPYIVEPLFRKDSLDIDDLDRQLIAKAVSQANETQIVITHGTDTMVQTAKVLEPHAHNKTIVMFGAMQPARMRDSDALFNLGAAFSAVQILPPGIYIAMNGRIFRPDNVRKNAAEHRFEPL